MAVSEYKAFQATGNVVIGTPEASGRLNASRQMEAQGLRPISIQATSVEMGVVTQMA